MKHLLIIYLLTSVMTVMAADKYEIYGTVTDSSTGEPLTGVTVRLKDSPVKGTATGLDGSFRLGCDTATPTIICSYIGYSTAELKARAGSPVNVAMSESPDVLAELVVTADAGGGESGARMIEHNSMNVVNVISARVMELSADISVGNAIQRMSGVTVERNSTGEGQYAILRGMDKRYNYTLVNGVRIPSPDNKNRFVPLDLFPSETLERIEVSKSLTADLEGDGIGGAVNLVMKDAPSRRMLSVNASTGYNALFLDHDFLSFDYNRIVPQSPNESAGSAGDYGVSADNFTQRNLRVHSKRPLPDLTAGLTWGDRFFSDRLGLILSGCYQNIARGRNSDWHYRSGYDVYGVEHREYSERRQRLSVHFKPDFRLAPGHSLSWYNGYIDMRDAQVRMARNDKTAAVRLKWNRQYIISSTLAGSHRWIDGTLRLNWRGTFSEARSETPDNAQINIQGSHIATSSAAVRRWEHNSDRDWSGYADLAWSLSSGACAWEIKAGGMYRDKRRTSFFNEYTFDSATGAAHVQVFGTDWNNFDGILITPREYGNIGDPLNYDATERLGAAYAMAKLSTGRWEFIAGIRMEHTDQGYSLRFPRDVDPEGRQRYYDWLPDFHARFSISPRMDIRMSYARAVNRPSFFEIVPYSIINEEYKEKGNPHLRHTVADNIDLRWEFFPGSAEQIMAGLFYKHLENPIEYGLVTEGQDTYYMPMNLGNASNMGVEVDVMKYFNRFGIKANYTFTRSRIVTDKRSMQGNEVVTLRQSRPLYGQAAHVANLSLIYKDTARGWDAQLTTSYISPRLCDISNWYDNDIWENDYFRLELSAEKSFGFGLSVFLKASNLLNLPLERYYHKGPHTDALTDVRRVRGNVLERSERFGQTLMIGVRFRL